MEHAHARMRSAECCRALYANGCPPERIMAILRWKSEEALLIYARLNDSERTDWVNGTMSAVVDSTVAAHLPRLDPDEWVAGLMAAARDGSLSAATRQAQRDAERDDELGAAADQ